MQFNINQLKEMLDRGPMTFIFKKKDGNVRKMTATTNKEWIPNKERIQQRSDKAITVYDMEKQDFRSVSVDAFIVA